MQMQIRSVIKKSIPVRCVTGLLSFAGRKSGEIKEKRGKQIWLFNAGSTFTGNPKWLFLYIVRHRPDIEAYWICENRETVRQVRGLGFRAYSYSCAKGIFLQSAAKVYCVEQVKEHLPGYLSDSVVYLNLFHGVGCKQIEKKLRQGYLVEQVAEKYIRYNDFYQKHMLFLVTSPMMERHFAGQCGLRESMLVRGGYPRCIYQRQYGRVHTFEWNPVRDRGLPQDTRIALYVPTFRDDPSFDFWGGAFPEPERLQDVLEEKHLLLIIKAHPHMEKDPGFAKLKDTYALSPWLMIWDNHQDIYEIFPDIALGIVDYSSIFYDMLSCGVPHFIRYFFDFDRETGRTMREFAFDIGEMTCGTMCRDFSQLLEAVRDYEHDDPEERERIMDLFWAYDDESSMERIIDQAKAYRPDLKLHLPILYSFSLEGSVFPQTEPPFSGTGPDAALFRRLVKQGKEVIIISNAAISCEEAGELLDDLLPDGVKLPMYLAGETGKRKETKELYLDAYAGFDEYNYSKWVHFGPDRIADCEVPARLGIKAGRRKKRCR